MRILFLVAAVVALAWARPETYKETEDFKYSRSSSDEGSKSGYYGAQRGNTAGNYERAHNMDPLAQHQMSGAINQVEGELGDASKTQAGSVYTAANSRGVYGSGHYDLSNLQGRHFGESSSADSSHSSLSSAYNQHLQNSDWRSQSQQTGYGASSQLGQSSLHTGNLHDAASGYGASSLEGSNSHSTGYHSAAGYHSQSGYNSQSIYDRSQLSGQSSEGYRAQAGDQGRRYTIVAPVRFVGRPGTQIAIPVYAQAHGASSLYDQSLSSNRQSYASQRAASTFDENAINSEAEVLNNNQQQIGSVPVSDGKHYSSAWNYHKAWERHSETTDSPITVAPTVNPLSIHSELHEDSQGASGSNHLQQAHSQNSYSGNAYNSAYSQSGSSRSSQSSHQSDYRSLHSAQAGANSNAYTQGTYGSHTGLAPLVGSEPKSYQSSYSYHKSWERQGDPYVIVPATNGEASQRLTSGNTKTGASSQRYGSQQLYSQGGAVDCDSLCRYRRSTRSYSNDDYNQQTPEDLGQQAQTGWEENLSQQTQQLYRPAKLEDLGQQTQGKWQESESNLEDLVQQTQQSWDNSNIEQQSSQNLENFGQHSQGHRNTENQHFQQNLENFDNFGQQTQSNWGNENVGQQTQQTWNNLGTIEQQNKPQQTEDLGQQTHNNWDNLDNLGQQVQTQWGSINTGHTATTNTEQQTQTHFGGVNEMNPNREHAENSNVNPDHPAFWGLDEQKYESNHYYNQHHSFNNHNSYSQTHGTSWEQQVNNNNAQATNNNPLQSLWDKIDNIEEQSEHSSNDNQQHPEYENSQHSYAAENTSYHESNLQQSTSHHETQYPGYQPSFVFNKTVDESMDERLHSEATTAKHAEVTTEKHPEATTKDDDLLEGPESAEIGRGDIGAEGESAITSKSEVGTQIHTTHIKPEKSPEEIEALSLSRGTEDVDSLSVLSISQQKLLDQQRQRAAIGLQQENSFSATTTTRTIANGNTTPKTYINVNHHEDANHSESGRDFSNSNLDHNHGFKNESKESSEHPEETGQHNRDLNQQNFANFEQHNQNFDQQNTGQQLEDFGQQSQDFNQQNLQQFTNLGLQSQNFDQQNTGQQLDDFGQQNQNLNQQNLHQFTNLDEHTQSFDQQNAGQQLEDFGQQSQNLNQQNLEPLVNLGQHNQNFDQQNTGQQLDDFGQQNQNLNQQNLHQFTNLDEHTQSFDQQNAGQQLEDFGQQSQNLNQQNLEPFVNLGQHNQNFDQQNAGQQLEDFGQQSQNLNQQNPEPFVNLGQHNQNFDQQNAGQQLEDFGQETQGLHQQNLQQFEHLGQHSQNIHQQNAGQQFEDFGQQRQDLNQQNLQPSLDLGQQTQKFDQHQAREFVPNSKTQPIKEDKIIPVNSHGSQTHPKEEVEIVAPSVTTTEKPGFWKSVGSKFSNAKDSVASWFRRS